MAKKILIVDDESDIIDIFTDYFQDAGWTTESAANGLIAMTKIKEFQPDVILSDINMPQMDGMQLLEELFKQESEIPVIFVTGFRDVEKMKRAWSLCAFDFLDKPFNRTNVIQTAENAFDLGRDYVRSARKRFMKNITKAA